MAPLPVHHPLDREIRQLQDCAGAFDAWTVRPTIDDLVANDILNAAYDWLCRRRRDYPDDADVWTLRRTWPTVKATLGADLLVGRYRLGLPRRVVNRAGDRLDCGRPATPWCSRRWPSSSGGASNARGAARISKATAGEPGHGGTCAARCPPIGSCCEPTSGTTTPPLTTIACSIASASTYATRACSVSWATKLLTRVSVVKPALVVVDPLRMFWPLAETKRNEEAVQMIKLLRQASESTGCSWLITHHRRKASQHATIADLATNPQGWFQEAAGAHALINQSDTRLGLELPEHSRLTALEE